MLNSVRAAAGSLPSGVIYFLPQFAAILRRVIVTSVELE